MRKGKYNLVCLGALVTELPAKFAVKVGKDEHPNKLVAIVYVDTEGMVCIKQRK